MIQIEGKVIGKARPRVTKNGIFTPKNTRDYEKKIADAWRGLGIEPFKGPVEVNIYVERKMPDSRPKKLEAEYDVFKPDVDNIMKTVLDALNGVAYLDDKQVYSASVVKLKRKRKEEDTLLVSVNEVSHER